MYLNIALLCVYILFKLRKHWLDMSNKLNLYSVDMVKFPVRQTALTIKVGDLT